MLKTMLGLELLAMLENCAADVHDAVQRMADVRVLIHDAARTGSIPVSEWRFLVERSSEIQKEFTFRP